MIKRTVVIMALAMPDQNRKVYHVCRATGASTRSRALTLGDFVTSLVVPYHETIDYQALAEVYATDEYPVWEKL